MDWKNKLYFGDNLKILREYVTGASATVIPANGLPPRRRGAGIYSGNLRHLDAPFNFSAQRRIRHEDYGVQGFSCSADP
jgi:hypothetical protein